MSLSESVDYDPREIEKYVVSHMDFFKRWTLNNITLTQLNNLLVEQLMMPAAQRTSDATDISTQVIIIVVVR